MVGIDADDVGTNPTITLEGVHDSIVSSRTLQCYVGEIMKFLLWCVENKPNWLMANETDHIAHIMEEHGGEGVCAQRSYTRTEIFGLLCSCDESPVLLLGEVTPHGVYGVYGLSSYMGWARIFIQVSLWHYSCSVFHLFHIHNCVRFSEIFHKELGILFRGFFQQLTHFPQQEGVGEHLQAGGGDGTVVINAATHGCRINKEGKDPMSVELYKKLCGGLLDWNTSDGVFGHCFLMEFVMLCAQHSKYLVV